MRRLAVILLGTLAVARADPAPSAGTQTVRLPHGEVRLFVPEIFEPLRPGSVYPDRRRPASALRRPTAIVAAAGGGEILRDELLARGVAVAEFPSAGPAGLSALLDALAARPEVDPARISLVVRALPASVDPRVAAVAVISSSPQLAIPNHPPLVTRFFAAVPDGEPSPGRIEVLASWSRPGISFRWYRGDSGLPPEALRDAAEFVAAVGGDASTSASVSASSPVSRVDAP